MTSVSQRLKLMLLIPTLDQSGAEKQLTLLACGLNHEKYDVHVVALTRGGPYAEVLKSHGIRVTVLNKHWKFDPWAMSRLRVLIQLERPDILHTWLFAANSYGRLIVGNRMNPRPKIVVSERCVDVWKAGWQKWLDRRLIARTDRLVANSEAVAEYYRSLGVPSERITVIHNGIEIPMLTSIDADRLLAELEIPRGSPVIGYVGRLARQKRVDDLIFAMALVAILRPDAHLLLVGDGPERDKLMKFARDVNVDHLIRFTGHRSDATNLLRLMNVFWLASDFEGLSNSIMEAMALGLPVIATNIPPNRELVVDGETGFLVKVGDRAGFQQFTDRLLADPTLARRLGEAGRDRVNQHFDVDDMVTAHDQMYSELMRLF